MHKETRGATTRTPNSEDSHIENEYLTLEVLEDDDKSLMKIKQTDHNTGEETILRFRLQQYEPNAGESNCEGRHGTPSGAEIFNPSPYREQKFAFSRLSFYENYKGASTGVQQIVSIFELDNREMYTVLITLLPSAKTVEWQVELFGLPEHWEHDR